MITVFTPSFADDDNTNAQNLTVKEVVARLDPARFRVVMLGSNKPDERIAARANTRILPWGKRAGSARILWHLLAEIPDLYFFPREGPLDRAFLVLRRRLNLKTALVTYVVSGGLEKDNRPLLFRTIRESDIAAGNSHYMAEITQKLGGRNVQTIYDGIDRRYYYAEPGSSQESGERRVLFASSFRRYKRADLMIREAEKLPQWEFRLAGEGEEEAACRRLAEARNCRNVRFLGHLNSTQLGEEMRQAKILFHPSEIEGHPQALGQAAACGLPCVARKSYNPDYVIEGVTGLLAGSDDELGEALARLTGDSDLRRNMSAAAIEHAAKFDWDDVAEQWSRVFELAVIERQNQRRQRIS
ncbi:MAG TPA: glycosyltransferase family 4 protein [Terriglobales bacterium]|nr:glycosyltransferase family 4 protein [Terriglobales bacterium]